MVAGGEAGSCEAPARAAEAHRSIAILKRSERVTTGRMRWSSSSSSAHGQTARSRDGAGWHNAILKRKDSDVVEGPSHAALHPEAGRLGLGRGHADGLSTRIEAELAAVVAAHVAADIRA